MDFKDALKQLSGRVMFPRIYLLIITEERTK